MPPFTPQTDVSFNLRGRLNTAHGQKYVDTWWILPSYVIIEHFVLKRYWFSSSGSSFSFRSWKLAAGICSKQWGDQAWLLVWCFPVYFFHTKLGKAFLHAGCLFVICLSFVSTWRCHRAWMRFGLHPGEETVWYKLVREQRKLSNTQEIIFNGFTLK